MLKKEHNRLLGILARAVQKKYHVDGYSTDYAMDAAGVRVVFQKVRNYQQHVYFVKFNEIKVGE